MFLPFIMEYSGPLPSDYVVKDPKKKETMVKPIRTFELFDYIYLLKEDELLKYKVELDHMDVVNVLEKYISTQYQYSKEIMSLKEVEKTNIPVKFLYYLGKYKLENNILKTKNYLVPEQTEFLEFLTTKYDNEVVTSRDLNILSYLIYDEKKWIDYLFNNCSVELIEKYQFNKDQINNAITNIEKLLKNTESTEDVLYKLKYIISNFEDNQKIINKLGLQEKFDKALNKHKQKVK